MTLNELRQHYFFELDRKTELEKALGLPIAALSALAGVVGVYAKDWRCPISDAEWAFTILTGVGATGLVGSFCFLFRTLLRHDYKVIGDAQAYVKFRKDLEEYHSGQELRETIEGRRAETGSSNERFQRDYETQLGTKYAEAIDLNSGLNIEKAALLYWMRLILAWTAFSLALASMPYFVLHRSDARSRTQSQPHPEAPIRSVIDAGEQGTKTVETEPINDTFKTDPTIEQNNDGGHTTEGESTRE